MAANSPLDADTTVGFVGRGPTGRPALYVGATYTGTGSTSVRQAVPAVSSRSLDDETEVSAGGVPLNDEGMGGAGLASSGDRFRYVFSFVFHSTK